MEVKWGGGGHGRGKQSRPTLGPYKMFKKMLIAVRTGMWFEMDTKEVRLTLSKKGSWERLEG